MQNPEIIAKIAAALRDRWNEERRTKGWWAAHELLDDPEDLEAVIGAILDERDKIEVPVTRSSARQPG
jgi:hypothetical protein